MIFIQFVSSFSGSRDSYGPILGPYEKIDIDYRTIRLFDGCSQYADVIEYDEKEKGYYYDGVIYNLFSFVDDPRKARNMRGRLQSFSQKVKRD